MRPLSSGILDHTACTHPEMPFLLRNGRPGAGATLSWSWCSVAARMAIPV